ncbi:MAG: ABC transporter ATP-binding protein [Candidatus Omnitrophica bacterium]|nr:ABC transporter ATP-binding protein [Candidatus Omnitrophota bacterium]
MTDPDLVLQVRDLTVNLAAGDAAPIVSAASFAINRGRIFALVGGSGSGKTTLAYAVLSLLQPGLVRASGKIVFGYPGRDLCSCSAEELRLWRGREVGMVFQEPLHAFNPLFTIGDQITEVLKHHTDLSPRQRGQRILEVLQLTGLTQPSRAARQFPHQLSGGMRQRAMIALAIACQPRLLIADEPTSSLDVTVQARLMELFRKLNQEMGLAIFLISHDLGMVGRLADDMAVMRQGRIVEQGAVKNIMAKPAHTYTRQLLEAALI